MNSTFIDSEKKAPDRKAGGEALANQVGGVDSRQPACQRITGCKGGSRTRDLRGMNPASFRCSTLRLIGARSRLGRMEALTQPFTERNGHGTYENRTHARDTQRHTRRTRRASFCFNDANAKRAARSIRTAAGSACTKKDFRQRHSCRNNSSGLCDGGRLCGKELVCGVMRLSPFRLMASRRWICLDPVRHRLMMDDKTSQGVPLSNATCAHSEYGFRASIAIPLQGDIQKTALRLTARLIF